MTQPKFSIGMLGGACEGGAKQAGALFVRGQHYSVADTIAAGASPENIVWLLIRRSKEDPAALAFMQAWARRACREYNAPSGRLTTAEACFDAVKDAMRARKKALGSSRGGKEWAYSHLVALANEGNA